MTTPCQKYLHLHEIRTLVWQSWKKKKKASFHLEMLSTVQFSRSVVSDSLRPPGLQHARLPCPLPTPGACSNSYPLSWWCHSNTSSSVIPFSSCPQSLPASGSFPMTELFISGGQSIGALTSVSVLSMNIQGGFPLGSTGLIYCCPRDSQESSPTPQFKSISSLQHSAFFMVQLSHLCMTTGKTIAWTI